MNAVILEALSGRAELWDEGAKWVLEELNVLSERQPITAWLAAGENPYREGSK